MTLKGFPNFQQLDSTDCGPACLKIIAKYYGKSISLEKLKRFSGIDREGISIQGLASLADQIGLRSIAAKIPLDKIANETPLPFIGYWYNQHYVVVYKVTKNWIYISDPSHGLIKLSYEEFQTGWGLKEDQSKGIALFLEPTPDFFELEDEPKDRKSFYFLFNYIRPYRKLIVQLFFGVIIGGILQLISPFLVQSIVDIGIKNEDIPFITLILIAQLTLHFGSVAVDFIKNWILLHLGTKLSISLLSDYLKKLMDLPISFFQNRNIGDLMQRIGDHKRIEVFVTSTFLNLLYSTLTFLIFSWVLLIYNSLIFLIFLIGSITYVGWVWLFMKKRKDLDYRYFSQFSRSQDSLIEIITGIKDIKLSNSIRVKRWSWEGIQAKIYRLSLKGLFLEQYQTSGSGFINEIKNLMITFIAARLVINGEITLGMMLAIQFILGQLNSPVAQFVRFMRSYQDAKLSLIRLGEVHLLNPERDELKDKINYQNGSIHIENVSFWYHSSEEKVLDNINIKIPSGKTTAIVGSSGSGKTSLINLILGFFEPNKGRISVNGVNLNKIDLTSWRKKCGVVLQDGFLFSDTLINNICMSQNVDLEWLNQVIESSNLSDLVNNLPLGYETKIGGDGQGLSQGQKQRVLIARAIYKNPDYFFLDEATNSLDVINEHQIIKKLNSHLNGKTVIVVAHRLSTIRHADQIIVINDGKVLEIGTHDSLMELRGGYFELIKNQL